MSKLVRDLNFKNLIFEWLQNFLSHISLDLVKGYFSRFKQKILSQVLVDIPNVA